MELNFIDRNGTSLVLFDMDGVLAEFRTSDRKDIDNNIPGVYLKMRPVNYIINQAKLLNESDNIDVGILSSAKFGSQEVEKREWLKKYMPFLSSENIYIIVQDKEGFDKQNKDYAKLNVIKQITGYDHVYLIDDMHKYIRIINDEIPNCAHHISEIIE